MNDLEILKLQNRLLNEKLNLIILVLIGGDEQREDVWQRIASVNEALKGAGVTM